MPVFISYSQRDSDFVDTLARNLVRNRHHIWMDRWELKVGDSLIEKIQSALVGSSAVLVILSKNSVESEWCKKELNATLMRELDERKALLLPCVIDDCEIPLFLREKLYADFRRDPDKAFNDVDRALARFTNPLQGRSESPDWNTDWSVSWGTFDDDPMRQVIEFTFVDHGAAIPYTVMSQCRISCNPEASQRFVAATDKNERDVFIRDILAELVAELDQKDMTIILDGPRPKFITNRLARNDGESFLIELSARRMGNDNGRIRPIILITI
jgi:hypothetical protein